MLGHCDKVVANKADERRSTELEADAFAGAVLWRYSQLPPIWWEFASRPFDRSEFIAAMPELGRAVVAHYEEPDEPEGAPASTFLIHSSFTVQAAAMFLAMHELIERVLDARSREGGSGLEDLQRGTGDDPYPAAEQRWEAYRGYCIDQLGVPEFWFGLSWHIWSGKRSV